MTTVPSALGFLSLLVLGVQSLKLAVSGLDNGIRLEDASPTSLI